jgi:hypothetical protein
MDVLPFFHIHNASTHNYISLLSDIQFYFFLSIGCYDSMPNGMPLQTFCCPLPLFPSLVNPLIQTNLIHLYYGWY